jgi:hypothetical protein
LQAEGGGGKREAEADDEGGRPVDAEKADGAHQHKAGNHDLDEAEAENLAAQRPEPARLQLEADDEQEEDDAELADMQDLLAVAVDQPEHRAHDDAGEEVAEHRAEADALEDGAGEDATAEQQDHFQEERRRGIHGFAILSGSE